MERHLTFWLGFFAAAFLSIPIGLFIWGAAGDMSQTIAVFIFGCVAALVTVLVLLLLFKDRILQKLLGRSEATLEGVVDSLSSILSATLSSDRQEVERELQALSKKAVGWYAWVNFYRWVINSGVALLLVFGAFTGTVLLFEQTKKLGEQTLQISEQTKLLRKQGNLMEAQTLRLAEQNELMAAQNEITSLSFTAALRDRLLNAAVSGSWKKVAGHYGTFTFEEPIVFDKEQNCALAVNPNASIDALPNFSEQIDIAWRLQNNSETKSIIEDTLNALLYDENDQVALAALMILDDAQVVPKKKSYIFSDLYIEGISLRGSYNISFFDSFIEQFTCELCETNVHNSLLWSAISKKIHLNDTILIDRVVADEKTYKNVVFRSSQPLTSKAIRLQSGTGFSEPKSENAFFVWPQSSSISVCDAFKSIAEDSRFLSIFRHH